MEKLLFILTLLITLSCAPTNPEPESSEDFQEQLANKKQMTDLMKKHLDAVTNRDLKTLESTLSPNGDMQLILPGTEIIKNNEGFMKYHSEWFADTTTTWTFETEILNTSVGIDHGMAITQVIYKEPMRNGKPYFNRMIVSYDLEKIEGNWFLIKDHASSIEKSTDQK